MTEALTIASAVMQRWGDDHMGDGWGWVMMAFIVVLGLALIGAVIYLATRDTRTRDSGSPSARDVLDHRFARGEIDDEEYRTRRELLG